MELLADFVADVAIVGVEFGQGVGVGVDVVEGEFGLLQGLHDLEDIEGPASLFDFEIFERA